MTWTRSETLALAQQSCSICFGLGLRQGRGGHLAPCHCVFRAVFRACYQRFRQAGNRCRFSRVAGIHSESRTSSGRGTNWSMKDQEYCADFCLIARRVLGVDSLGYRIFRFHVLLGADWKLCCRRLRMDRGAFFHEVYRVQQQLGRAFRETEPHALFPTGEYFGGVVHGCKVRAPDFTYEADADLPASALRFPLARGAA